MIDFGIAGVCEKGQADKVDAGSIHYMAPECFMGHAVESNPALDVWAIGLMFYSMLYGTLPFYSDDEDQLIERIKGAKLRFDKKVPVTKEAKEVITKMLDRDPEKRLDLNDFVEMAYYDWSDEQAKEKIKEAVENHDADAEEKKEDLATDFRTKLNIPGERVSGTGSSPRRAKKKPVSPSRSSRTVGTRGTTKK